MQNTVGGRDSPCRHFAGVNTFAGSLSQSHPQKSLTFCSLPVKHLYFAVQTVKMHTVGQHIGNDDHFSASLGKMLVQELLQIGLRSEIYLHTGIDSFRDPNYSFVAVVRVEYSEKE